MRRKYIFVTLLLMTSLLLCACGKDGEQPDPQTETVQTEEDYYPTEPESIAVSDVHETESIYFGVIHAVVTDIQQGGSYTIYSFVDELDTDNVFSISTRDIADIEVTMSQGQKVAVIYHGDIVRDFDHVEWILIMPEYDYRILRAEGTLINNGMNTFSIEQADGTEMVFLRNNFKTESGLSFSATGTGVVVYYVEGGDGQAYPVKVYAQI